MSRPLITSDERQELLDAADAIGMGAEALDHLIDTRFARIRKPEPSVRLFEAPRRETDWR